MLTIGGITHSDMYNDHACTWIMLIDVKDTYTVYQCHIEATIFDRRWGSCRIVIFNHLTMNNFIFFAVVFSILDYFLEDVSNMIFSLTLVVNF